jgi:hypothetical protein
MMLQRLHSSAHPLPERVRRYVESQWQRPAVQEFCAQRRPTHQRVRPWF